jgi:Probable cobalt transporter subunit (CbtA)
MMRALLIRGMLVGVLAGLLSFGVARVLGEPQVDRAIAYEEQMDAAHAGAGEADHQHGTTAAAGHDHGAAEQSVSRGTQRGIGLLTASVVYGAALGGLFAIVFGLVYGRVGPWNARTTALLLAVAAFLTIYFVPTIKYPANPPAVGIDDTIVWRTQLFFAMIAMAIAAMIVAVMVAKASAGTRGAWDATLLGSAVFVGLVVLAGMLMPTLGEVPANFPADVLAEFRMASLAIQGTLWATLGLVFGRVADSVLHDTTRTLPPARASSL